MSFRFFFLSLLSLPRFPVSPRETDIKLMRIWICFESIFCSKTNFNLVIKIAFCILLNVISSNCLSRQSAVGDNTF